MNELMDLATTGDDDASFELATKGGGGGYLRRLKLYQANAAAVVEGKAQAGWGAPDDSGTIKNFGESANVIPLARRLKAVDYRDKENVREGYGENDPLYKEAIESSPKDVEWGVSVLVWEHETEGFYEVFYSSPSARKAAKEIFPFIPGQKIAARPATLGKKIVPGKKGMFAVPTAGPCEIPFEVKADLETVKAEVAKFVNPTKTAEVDAPSS